MVAFPPRLKRSSQQILRRAFDCCRTIKNFALKRCFQAHGDSRANTLPARSTNTNILIPAFGLFSIDRRAFHEHFVDFGVGLFQVLDTEEEKRKEGRKEMGKVLDRETDRQNFELLKTMLERRNAERKGKGRKDGNGEGVKGTLLDRVASFKRSCRFRFLAVICGSRK